MLMPRDKSVLKYLEEYKAISVIQASKLFFDNKYDSARKRLKILEENNFLKSYENKLNNQKVYYIEKMISSHDLLIMDVYAEIKSMGFQICKFKKTPQYLNGRIVPDAYIEFITIDANSGKKYKYFFFIEVDLSHFTGANKFQLYEKMCRDNVMEVDCGTDVFPNILILRPTKNDNRYRSGNFNTIYTNFELSNPSFSEILTNF